jgi:hypothetical protein
MVYRFTAAIRQLYGVFQKDKKYTTWKTFLWMLVCKLVLQELWTNILIDSFKKANTYIICWECLATAQPFPPISPHIERTTAISSNLYNPTVIDRDSQRKVLYVYPFITVVTDDQRWDQMSKCSKKSARHTEAFTCLPVERGQLDQLLTVV